MEASAHPNRFVAYLAAKRPLIETALRERTPHPYDATSLQASDLEHYLYAPLDLFTQSGGKRTRPALALLGCEAVGGDAVMAVSVACAVEDFQSAALIHDDIADEGSLRRGKPCVHITEGVGIALTVGDLALTESFADILTETALAPDVRLRLLGELLAMERMTLEGQALDLGWVRDDRWDITPDDYLFMAQHKTAFYSGASPLVMGALCGGATNEQVQALRSFGLDVGLAFQLQDDLLNLIGDAAAQGKDFRSDITEGKRTLAVVWALTHLEQQDRAELLHILRSGCTDAARLARAVVLMETVGALDHVREEAQRLVVQAHARLSGSALEPDACETLLAMADFFVGRTY